MFEESNKDKVFELIKKAAVTAIVLFYLFFVIDKFDNIFNFKSTLFSSADQRPAQHIDNQDSAKDKTEDEPGKDQNQQDKDEDQDKDSEENSQGEDPVDPVTEETPNQSTEKIIVEITPGMPLVSIASQLYDMGLIENEFEFLKEVDQMSAETKLQAGTFKIPFDADYQQIIKILIGQI